MRRRQAGLAALLLCVVDSSPASVFEAVLHCSGRATDWTTGLPVTADLTVVPAARTDRPLWVGGAPNYDAEPLTLGVGVSIVTWSDGVLGVRRDRALQLTQPGSDRTGYAPIQMPLVILGFRQAPSGSIPLLLQIEVHQEGIPFRAWLPGRPELLTGFCDVNREAPSATDQFRELPKH